MKFRMIDTYLLVFFLKKRSRMTKISTEHITYTVQKREKNMRVDRNRKVSNKMNEFE